MPESYRGHRDISTFELHQLSAGAPYGSLREYVPVLRFAETSMSFFGREVASSR